MDWRGLWQRIAAFWEKVPKPVRQLLSVALIFWRVLGWIDDHLGRIVVLLLIIGSVIAGGAFVIGYYLSEVDPLWIYLGVLGSIAILIWGAAGVVNLMQASFGTPPVPTVPQPATEQSETIPARLRIVPMALNGEASLRIENEGPNVAIAARLERIDGVEDQTLPYRLGWKPEGAEVLALTRKELTQKMLGIGTIGFVQITEAWDEDAVQFKMPGGIFLPVPRPDSGQLGIEIQYLSDPPMKSPSRRAYVLEFAEGDAEVVEFKEKLDPEPEPDGGDSPPQ